MMADWVEAFEGEAEGVDPAVARGAAVAAGAAAAAGAAGLAPNDGAGPDPPAGPPGGRVGNLMVGAAEGLGGVDDGRRRSEVEEEVGLKVKNLRYS